MACHVKRRLAAAAGTRAACARLRRDAGRVARDWSGRTSSDRLRGNIVAARLFREGGCGVARAPSQCNALGHRTDIVVPARTVDASAGCGRGGPNVLPHGPRSPTHPGVFRRRGRFSLGQLPDQHWRRDRRAAAGNTVRPTHLRFQPPTLERRNLSHAAREDTSMVRCFAPPLTLAVMLWGLVPAAWATGPLGRRSGSSAAPAGIRSMILRISAGIEPSRSRMRCGRLKAFKSAS